MCRSSRWRSSRGIGTSRGRSRLPSSAIHRPIKCSKSKIISRVFPEAAFRENQRIQLQTMELMELRMLVAVAEESSIQKAAERVFRAPRAVSMALRKLEVEVAASIFDRSEPREHVLTARRGSSGGIRAADADTAASEPRQFGQFLEPEYQYSSAPLRPSAEIDLLRRLSPDSVRTLTLPYACGAKVRLPPLRQTVDYTTRCRGLHFLTIGLVLIAPRLEKVSNTRSSSSQIEATYRL